MGVEITENKETSTKNKYVVILCLTVLSLCIGVVANVFIFQLNTKLSQGFATIEFDVNLSNVRKIIINVSSSSGAGNCFIVGDANFKNSYVPEKYTISVWYADTYEESQKFEEAFKTSNCSFHKLGNPDNKSEVINLVAQSTYYKNIWR